eukprot:TRINITY_DN3067_c0_g1_i2.p1 TRINITY_DN3067_c0_g1~~TRINITY_DN3067_c0_g1_i2.p1  ORF type:complete len:432 (+),score=190.50 TRINITY_DN3067_c0_g1_i2:672-1967(+)
MGKSGGFLTAKAIGNRIKSKGLQKLKFFCQMCQKQCRDANGFKCHLQSESHLRQMKLFGENAGKFINDFSDQFEQDFMSIVSRRYKTVSVKANSVYNEMIAHKMHTHMNATKWHTLSDFVKYLGKSGQCVVEDTEKGWYIKYIDRDPEAMRRAAEKKKMALSDQMRERKMLEKQIEKAKLEAERNGINTSVNTEQKKPVAVELDKTLEFSFDLDNKNAGGSAGGDGQEGTTTTTTTTTSSSSSSSSSSSKPKKNVFAIQPVKERKTNSNSSNTTTNNNTNKINNSSNGAGKRKLSELELIMQQDKRKKEKVNRTDNWVCKGIIVRVMHKKLANGKYYEKKGVVLSVKDLFTAEIKMKKTGDVLKLDQAHLETVLPKVGGTGMIVNGGYRGETATVLKFNTKDFTADVEIEKGLNRGTKLTLVYEDLCKMDK